MLILLSSPNRIENEAQQIHSLFANGLQTLHLRKPNWEKKDYETLLKGIAPEHKRKVVLHQYHELAAKYNVKGLHLREEVRLKMPLLELKNLSKKLKVKNVSLSSSFHSTDRLPDYDGIFDYVFLSPVFDSISKPNYFSSKFEMQSLKLASTKIIALGGVDRKNIPKAIKMGFDGVAVLGAVWQAENPSKTFTMLKDDYLSLTLNTKP